MKQHVYYITSGADGYTEITVTPKEYWTTKRFVADFEEDDIIAFFENIGFYREGDSFFVGNRFSAEEMNNLLASNENFVYDKDFIDFVKY